VLFVLDLFTKVGALLGFISAGFLIYDRLFRYRPVVSIKTVRGKATLPGQVPPNLHIRNVAPFHLLIERFVVTPRAFEITPDFYPVKPGTTLATYGAGRPILLAPNEERDLAMVATSASVRGTPKTARIDIAIHWRRDVSTGLLTWPVRFWPVRLEPPGITPLYTHTGANY
jgi:hypothetical protein